MTLGEEGSGFSKAALFFPPVGNIGEAWPAPVLLRLPLLLSRRLREEDREICEEGSLARPGLRMDLEDEIFMEEDERREVKQMKSSLVPVLQLLLPPLLVAVRWGLSEYSINDFLLCFSMVFGHFWRIFFC